MPEVLEVSIIRPGHIAANITALNTTPPNESEPPLDGNCGILYLSPCPAGKHRDGYNYQGALISKEVARSEGDRGEGNEDFKLVWYKAQYGDNLRNRCFVRWEEKGFGRQNLDLGVGSGVDEVTCLFCRAWWQVVEMTEDVMDTKRMQCEACKFLFL
ncbi:uncharacterized protein PADG_06098 [Paracoccidioides brasiliensis Pb18]|uniref:Uncharacterized protein n=1 Tax=Paracoccidioides brasiliensis (strain Pb18) TaxID=502780 RepID=C1GFR2_PARBD|nr:uncharacterized protein PADG_06098 [Paracoccidioides brasiliensis Pb18]EEH50019.1 hypothetical protein PADG_06098 [Paracoccidioides brasiliensis Pb18]